MDLQDSFSPKSPSQPRPPTKVLYVRHLPDSLDEGGLASLCEPFGQVVKTLIPAGERRQGFVEFDDRASAISCHKFYADFPMIIDDEQLEFAYSGRAEITMKSLEPAMPSRVLLLTIMQLKHPVTVQVLQAIFKPIAEVEKIVVFNRGSIIQALVQVGTIESAKQCLAKLDGQYIYEGCNSLRVQYSSLDDLRVDINTDRSFDKTLPDLPVIARPTKDTSKPIDGSYTRNISHHPDSKTLRRTPGIGIVIPPVLAITCFEPKETTADNLAALAAVYGNVTKVKVVTRNWRSNDQIRGAKDEAVNQPGHPYHDAIALVTMGNLQQCRTCEEFLNKLNINGKDIHVEMATVDLIHNLNSIQSPKQTNTTNSPRSSYPPVTKSLVPSVPTGLTTKVNGSPVTPNVNGKDADQSSADQSSVLDCTKWPLLFNRHRVDRKFFPPSISLHASNMPDNTTEEELLAVLREVGGDVKHVRFLDEQNHIAIAVCASIDNAVHTLMRAHGKVIGGRPLRLGFGHQPMDPAFYAQNAPVYLNSYIVLPIATEDNDIDYQADD